MDIFRFPNPFQKSHESKAVCKLLGVRSILTYGGHIRFLDPKAAECGVKLYQKEYFFQHHWDSVVFILLRFLLLAHLLMDIKFIRRKP